MLDLVIRKSLGDFRLDISLQVPGGGVLALFGRSGAGKTSVISAIAGLLRPEDGHIRVAEQTLFDAARGIDLPPHRRRVGYVFQDARLFPHLTVRDNLLYGFRRAPKDLTLAHAPEHIIALLGIEHLLARRPAALSGGEKQRVALARALAASPKLLLLDEPLSALDETMRADAAAMLKRIQKEHALTILHVTHSESEAVQLADVRLRFEDGKVN